MAFVVLLLSLLISGCAVQEMTRNDLTWTWDRVKGSNFLKCSDLIHPGKNFYDIFNAFWDPTIEVMDEELGCVYICALYKSHILYTNGTLDEDYLRNPIFIDYDRKMVDELIEILRGCYHPATDRTMICAVGLEFFLCLRPILNKPEWKPIFLQ